MTPETPSSRTQHSTVDNGSYCLSCCCIAACCCSALASWSSCRVSLQYLISTIVYFLRLVFGSSSYRKMSGMLAHGLNNVPHQGPWHAAQSLVCWLQAAATGHAPFKASNQAHTDCLPGCKACTQAHGVTTHLIRTAQQTRGGWWTAPEYWSLNTRLYTAAAWQDSHSINGKTGVLRWQAVEVLCSDTGRFSSCRLHTASCCCHNGSATLIGQVERHPGPTSTCMTSTNMRTTHQTMHHKHNSTHDKELDTQQ